MMKIKIEKFDNILCDNGMIYEVIGNWKEEYDYFLVSKDGKIANEVNDNYLNECYQDDLSICIGEDEKRNPQYAKITQVYDFRGIRKSK